MTPNNTAPTRIKNFLRSFSFRIGVLFFIALCTTLIVLREARALISDEAQWVQGVYERDGRHCAIGAVQAAGRGHWRGVRREAASELLHVARLHGHHSVESMNDSLTHPEVLAMFDTAIARVQMSATRGH